MDPRGVSDPLLTVVEHLLSSKAEPGLRLVGDSDPNPYLRLPLSPNPTVNPYPTSNPNLNRLCMCYRGRDGDGYRT